jgi:23S rRNA (uracil1939-C5)-methyltransferase
MLQSLRSALCRQSVNGVKEIICYQNDQNQTIAHFLPSTPPVWNESHRNAEPLTVSFRGYRFPMTPEVFLQVNPGLWRSLIQEVENHYENNTGSALELYCGAGFFTVALAQRFKRMTACEESQAAIQYARSNHGLNNVDWICSRVEQFRFPEGLDAVIVDPPRSGLHSQVLRQLIAVRPRLFTYISCDCATFSRDLKKLKEHYRVRKITMLDLFPQTYHFETVALLEKIP